MAYTIEQIAVQQLNSTDFVELANKIVQGLVTQNGNVLEDVIDKFSAYLDSDTTIDNVQKQSAYAGFLKDIYSDINKQALGSAMELMKTNLQYQYEKYNVQASYNQTLIGIQKTAEEIIIAGKQSVAADKNNALLDVQLLMAKAQLIEQKAKNEKQYGVANESYTLTLDNADGKFVAPMLDNTSGMIEFYETDVNGVLMLNQAGVDLVNAENTAWNTANPTDPAYPKKTTYVVGELTTTEVTKAHRFTSTTTSATVGSRLLSTGQGAIDKQIKGYDYVNYKDVLKTLDERAALMQNAKIPQTAGEKAARLALIKSVTSGLADMPASL